MPQNFRKVGLIVSTICLFFGTPKLACADSAFTSGNWVGSSYNDQNTGQFTHCAVSSSFLSGDNLMFGLTRNGDFGISVANQSWKLRPGDRYPVSIEIDRYAPMAGNAMVVGPSQASVWFPNAYELYQNVRRGRTLRIDTKGGILTYDLAGTSRALQRVSECLFSELDREADRLGATTNPFAVYATREPMLASKSDDYRLDRTEMVILASNVLGDAGISGYRFLPDQERTGAFASLDVAWIGPGDSAGGLSGVQLTKGQDLGTALSSLGATIPSEDAAACPGKYASIPGKVRVEGEVYRLE